MSATDSYDWKTDGQIREQEFRAGYDLEATRGGLRPEERNDGEDDPQEHTHMEGAASETTMWADIPQKRYNPHEALPSFEKYNTKGKKYARLWHLNAGRDDHCAAGKTYKDREIHKVNRPARDRARFVHAVANRCDLSKNLTDHCTKIARQLDPRAWNYWGGMNVFILAVVGYVAVTLGDRVAWSGDLERFHEIREQWTVSIDDLGAAIEKVRKKTAGSEEDTRPT